MNKLFEQYFLLLTLQVKRTLYTRSPTKTIVPRIPFHPSILPSTTSTLDDGSTFITFHPTTNQTGIIDNIMTTPLPEYVPLPKETIFEMRKLRQNDPKQWTVSALAKKYNLTKSMVLKWAPLPSRSINIATSKWQIS